MPRAGYVARVESIEALGRAGDAYRSRLIQVGAAQWAEPSTCEEWTVKELADHVLGGNRFAVSLLAGLSSPDAFAEALAGGFSGPPADQFDISAADQLSAFSRPGALDQLVDHPAGQISGRMFLNFRLGDLLLHGWDLARSTGGDEYLDADLVPIVWDAYLPVVGDGTGGDGFGPGPSGDLPEDSSLSLRLLDLTGRRA